MERLNNINNNNTIALFRAGKKHDKRQKTDDPRL